MQKKGIGQYPAILTHAWSITLILLHSKTGLEKNLNVGQPALTFFLQWPLLAGLSE